MHKWYVKMEEGAKKYCKGKGVKKNRQLVLKKTGNMVQKDRQGVKKTTVINMAALTSPSLRPSYRICKIL
jgi:hypothetical protein